MKKGFIRISCILLCLISFVVLVGCGKKTNFNSVQEYVDNGGFIYTDLPQNASDIQYYYDETSFSIFSTISYVISDEEEYDIYMESIKDDIMQEANQINDTPEWDSYGASYNEGANYTDEELEEMAYVTEHYLEMDYKEILSMTDHKFGFFSSYGAKVKDYTNMNYTLAEFPMKEGFQSVVEGSIENYTILDYYPLLSGKSCYGLLVDEEERRFIAFRISNMF